MFPTLPPPIQGLGQFGGFQFVVQDEAAHTLEELAATTQSLMRQAGQRKDLPGFSRRLRPMTRSIRSRSTAKRP